MRNEPEVRKSNVRLQPSRTYHFDVVSTTSSLYDTVNWNLAARLLTRWRRFQTDPILKHLFKINSNQLHRQNWKVIAIHVTSRKWQSSPQKLEKKTRVLEILSSSRIKQKQRSAFHNHTRQFKDNQLNPGVGSEFKRSTQCTLPANLVKIESRKCPCPD